MAVGWDSRGPVAPGARTTATWSNSAARRLGAGRPTPPAPGRNRAGVRDQVRRLLRASAGPTASTAHAATRSPPPPRGSTGSRPAPRRRAAQRSALGTLDEVLPGGRPVPRAAEQLRYRAERLRARRTKSSSSRLAESLGRSGAAGQHTG
ncbi:hypothetical protein HBB16_18170 [Pseudonocardia sp. MCCB 268]|nr:hypothetical protein [Pseudonocardia cytotoxica]